jgi:hypothetical protein
MHLKNYKNFTNEALNTNDFSFITKLKANQIHIGNYDHDQIDDINVKEAKVYWDLDIDVREWGVNSMIPFIKKIEIELDVIYFKGEDDYEEMTENIEIPIENIEYDIKIKSDQIEPDNIDFNYNQKTVIVEF